MSEQSDATFQHKKEQATRLFARGCPLFPDGGVGAASSSGRGCAEQRPWAKQHRSLKSYFSPLQFSSAKCKPSCVVQIA